MSGGTSAEELGNDIKAAALNPAVGSIVLDVDSPGGQVGGIPELAQTIREARGLKRIVAVANHEALSAAYWLASQADSVFVSPSGRVGSIGVIAAHEDRSRQQDAEGVTTTLITAGKFKGEGNPFTPLSEEARDHLQSEVNDMYAQFVEAVAAGRGIQASEVISKFGEGRTVGAKQALASGMVDGIATVDDVISSELRGIEESRQQVAGVRKAALDGAPLMHTVAEAPELTARDPEPEPDPAEDVSQTMASVIAELEYLKA
jgi:signal peptide peptidase SppA